MGLDLTELLDKHGIDYKTDHRDVRRDWLGVECPDCGRPGEYYLGIHLESTGTNCWRCGPKNPYEVLTALGVPAREAVEFLRSERPVAPSEPPTRGLYRPPKHIAISGQSGAPFAKYLRSRGFDPAEIAELWGVGGVQKTPLRYAWRLLIPIAHNGRWASWTTRSIDPTCPKGNRYLSAPPDRELFSPRSILYGADYCGHACIVVEGPTDVWRVGPGAVATLGLGATPEQEIAIAAHPIRVVAFDNSHGAQKRADSLCRRLAEYGGQTIRFLLTSPDVGSANDEEISDLKSYL